MLHRRGSALFVCSLLAAAAFAPRASGQGFEGRIFFPTAETVALYELNGLPDIFDGATIPDGTVIPDLSGKGHDAVVADNGTDLVFAPGDPVFDDPAGSNREVRRGGNVNGAARLTINDDQNDFEMAPEDDFSLEIYLDREVVDDPVKWGLLAGTWHSRSLPDDTMNPDTQGAWYGYGLIRGDEAQTAGQWSFVISPIEGVDGAPPLGCCNENHGYFNLEVGRHYLVFSVNRTDMTGITYVDGVPVHTRPISPTWSFTTPMGYEHATFTMYSGEDDPSRHAYRQAPAGANIDALRVQRHALTEDEVAEIWANIQAGQPSPPPPNSIQAFVSASKTSVITQQCVKLDASVSNPGLGKVITKYEWMLPGGQFETGEVTHEVSFADPSPVAGYEVQVRITNDASETSTAKIRIKVVKPTIIARIVASLGDQPLLGSEVDVPIGSVITLDGTTSSFNVPADAFSCPIANALPVEPPAITDYAWDLNNNPGNFESHLAKFDTDPFTKAGEYRINLKVTAADGSISPTRGLIVLRVVDGGGNNRIFHTTPDTWVHYEFNEISDGAGDGAALPTGSLIEDLSGNGIHATVEGNDQGDFLNGVGSLAYDVPPGSNLEVRRPTVNSWEARIGINDDQNAFEAQPEDDFSVELYLSREVTNDPIKWGILAGNWHSRNLLDDSVGDPEHNGAWYGYGLIRADESVTGGAWSWGLSPLDSVDSPPHIGCCWENHAFFDIPLGRHYVALSVDRVAQTAVSYVDGKPVKSQVLNPAWSFTTPTDYEHARFTLFSGEDDASRNSYRPCPAGTGIDAFRFQRKALSDADVDANWKNIKLGKGANPEFAPVLPVAPTGLAAQAGDGKVDLDWSDNTDAGLQGYAVLRSDAGGPFLRITPQPVIASSYSDVAVANGTPFCYQVVALTNAGRSPASTQACATPSGGTPPLAPSGLAATAGDGKVTLDWADNGDAGVLGYYVYRSTAGGAVAKITASPIVASNYEDTGLANDVEYCYGVTAVNASAEGPPSSPSCATPRTAGHLFRRGDIDGNGKIEVTDAIGILGHLFLGDNTAWLCAEAADTDNGGTVDVTDAVNNLNFQFLGGNPPAAPGPRICGPDEGTAFLGCDVPCN